ncbi:uncharacterized protein LOC132543821 [Ylistrum balloti]|uniref:uncharacterized protein LOC132543821 n=1 Tax=Ylistrum balloti TaxID=509963 RepID=UPI002905BEBD|nr:uncharacterized protein LOC132543821 [Ylistrum balloti]
MTRWYLVFVWILLGPYRDAAGTECSDAITDGTQVLNMCEDGKAEGGSVVIDTYGSSIYRQNGVSINCSCTATLEEVSGGQSTTLSFESVQSLQPSPGCGSGIYLIPQLQTFPGQPNTYWCVVKNNTFNAVKENDTFTVVWQSGNNGSTSGYCLSFSAGSESLLSVKCTPSPIYVTSTSSPTSPTMTVVTTTMTTSSTTTSATTTPKSSITTTLTTTTLSTTSDRGANPSSTKPTTMTEGATMADQMKDKDLDTNVIIGIAAGGVVFVGICIIIAVTCARRKRKPDEPGETSTVTHNVLYESYKTPETEMKHIVTPSGDIYAQVEKDSKTETTNSNDQSREPEQETPHIVTPSGDTYAQIHNTRSDNVLY